MDQGTSMDQLAVNVRISMDGISGAASSPVAANLLRRAGIVRASAKAFGVAPAVFLASGPSTWRGFDLPRPCRPPELHSLLVVDAADRTGADDDVLVEKLSSLAWSGYEGPHSSGCRPHQPFPPLAPTEIERAEEQIGYRLPPLFRRIYTEIGDGGFGPEAGLASLIPRRVPHSLVPDWPCATTRHGARPEWGPPASWLFLTDGGCTMQWYVSLIALDHPVLLWDADGYEPDWGQDAHDGLCYAAPSLRQWLWTWADGGEVWEGALNLLRRTARY